MDRQRKVSILLAVGAMLAAVLGILGNVIAANQTFTVWLDSHHLNSFSTLLKVFLGVLVATVVVALWQSTTGEEASLDSSSLPAQPLEPSLRLRLLNRIEHERVDARLRQGLRRALRIDLRLTETPEEVRPSLRIYETSESGLLSEREISQPIKEVFDRVAGGRLLILGDPGTGKTNLLLELATELIKDAKQNESLPLPIIFNLPRWTLGKRVRTLREWMTDDLVSEYNVSRAVAKSLVLQNRILPLLDGLDEVSEDRRAPCVLAVNALKEECDLAGLAVCCRSREYAGLPRIDLRTAIRVEKLDRAAVEREIARPRMEKVRRALKKTKNSGN